MEANKKLQIKLYYVDGSEQFFTVNTDSVKLAKSDYKNRIMNKSWFEFKGEDGKETIVNTRNIVNVEFQVIQ